MPPPTSPRPDTGTTRGLCIPTDLVRHTHTQKRGFLYATTDGSDM
jgi:hypothetical protein